MVAPRLAARLARVSDGTVLWNSSDDTNGTFGQKALDPFASSSLRDLVPEKVFCIRTRSNGTEWHILVAPRSYQDEKFGGLLWRRDDASEWLELEPGEAYPLVRGSQLNMCPARAYELKATLVFEIVG